MARDRASIRLDMWADQDWRDLSEGAQHLYMLLMSHPTLSYAGVADWKPGRLAAMTSKKTKADVLKDAAELQERFFIVVDSDSEEVLVRSFIKHDGLMKQPKLVVSMTNAYAAIASKAIREVIAFEVQKLHSRHPELNAWGVKQVQTLLAAKGTDIRTFTPGLTPPLTPGFTPEGGQGEGLPTSTATSTATEASLPVEDGDAKLKETRLPKAWAPTAEHFALAKSRGVDILAEVEAFRLHAETHDRHAARWNGAFTTWLKKSRPTARAAGPRKLMTVEELQAHRERVMNGA